MLDNYKKWLQRDRKKNSNALNEEIQLIEGQFNPIEAADVLLSLIAYKIKFHNLQLLNLDHCSSVSREQSEKRITELKEAKNKITSLIMRARDEGVLLDIKSNIKITCIPKDVDGR